MVAEHKTVAALHSPSRKTDSIVHYNIKVKPMGSCTSYRLFIVVLLSVCHLHACPSPEILRRIQDKEAIVTRLAEEVARLFEQRGRHLRNCECSTHACTSERTGFECTSSLGGNTEVCGDNCNARRINFMSSSFWTPPNTDPDDMDDRLKESICLYANLEPLMKKLVPRERANWLYFGSIDGALRIYPFRPLRRGLEDGDEGFNGCEKFDPRIRPWFIAASTRPKDIVFVIDTSESMQDPVSRSTKKSRWRVISKVVMSMLDTLASSDYVNVVTFSHEANRINTDSSLLQGTAENLEFLKKEVKDQYPYGGTNFDAAFQEAFSILKDACDENPETQSCSNCQKVILFLTDGRDTTGPDYEGITATEMLRNIERYQRRLERATDKRASIFTFSMGEESDDSIPRQIACANNGSWSYIGSDTDPLSAMSGYYRFLTNPDSNNSPVWVNPYIDAGGQGYVTTVSKAVFSRGTRRLDGVFLGVVGHTVLLRDLEAPGIPYQDVLDALRSRSGSCGALPQKQCQLQMHRHAHSEKAACADNVSFNISNYDTVRSSKPVCYSSRGKYYKLFFEKETWNEAKRKCRHDGGQLATIQSLEELAFVAGVASPDGSWIGAQWNSESDSWKWIDRQASSRNLAASSEYWANGEPNNHKGNENCVEIDRRGRRGNLNDANCDTPLSFICEYSDDRACTHVIEIPERGFFSMPSLDECIHEEESWIKGEPLDVAKDLGRSQVMCPLGGMTSSIRQLCCRRCRSRHF